MKKLLTTSLLTICCTTTLSAKVFVDNFSWENISVDKVGGHVGLSINNYSKSDKVGSLDDWNEPSTNLMGVDIYGTFSNVFDKKSIKPFISYTYLNNSDINQQYFLLGVNKYYQHNSLVYYAGAYSGISTLTWNEIPLNVSTSGDAALSRSLVLGLQGGLEYPLKENLSLDLNLKGMLHSHKAVLNESETVQAEVTHPSSIFMGVGLIYKFGNNDNIKVDNKKLIEKKQVITPKPIIKEKPIVKPPVVKPIILDDDKDGVSNINDKCPNSVENEIVDKDGCAKDSDSDGMIDRLDKCPNTIKGAIIDKKGCALLDSDNDGIFDINDSCPNSVENEIIDEKGCAKDSDKDGIIDRLDQCPNSDMGVMLDKHGCEIKFTLTIEFAKNSVVIDSKYDTNINKLVKFINNYPLYDVKIEAHTDSKGSEKYNQKISEKRAKALFDKLEASGIDTRRVRYSGLGEMYPIATNDTKEGRAKNRRIEVRFVKN